MTAGGRAPADAIDAFERATAAYRSDPDVVPGTGFGTTRGLRVRGRIFAMLARGDLVVKLPVARVDALVADGTGTRVEMGGRRMREWARIPAGAAAAWPALVDESYAYVRAEPR